MKSSLLFLSLLLLSSIFISAQSTAMPVDIDMDTDSDIHITEPVSDKTSRRISGKVVDENGMPIIGASVSIVQDSLNATVTDIDGRFKLLVDIDGEKPTIRISYIGYETVEIPVLNGTTEYAVSMPPVQSQLDEVVVIGYGTQRKVNLTGSVASISKTSLADRPLTNATNALAGLASGLTVTNSGGNTPGYEAQTIRVRGIGTLNDAAPLVVVDGMTGIAISDINPQDIENISILKDAASSAIYGSRAANGVILITTRRGVEAAPRLTYSGNVSFEKVAKRLNLAVSYTHLTLPTIGG